jgi:hypothetical protein
MQPEQIVGAREHPTGSFARKAQNHPQTVKSYCKNPQNTGYRLCATSRQEQNRRQKKGRQIQ